MVGFLSVRRCRSGRGGGDVSGTCLQSPQPVEQLCGPLGSGSWQSKSLSLASWAQAGYLSEGTGHGPAAEWMEHYWELSMDGLGEIQTPR